MAKKSKIQSIIDKFSKYRMSDSSLISAEEAYLSLIDLSKSINSINNDSFLSFIIIQIGRRLFGMKDLDITTCDYNRISEKDLVILRGFLFTIMFGIVEFTSKFSILKSPQQRKHKNIIEEMLENNPKDLEEWLKTHPVPKEFIN